MVNTPNNWARALKDIALLENHEAMLMSGALHTIAMSKKNGIYHVYDLNNPGIIYECKNEEEVLDKFKSNIFKLESEEGTLGIRISILRSAAYKQTQEDTENLLGRYHAAIYQQYLDQNYTVKEPDAPQNERLSSMTFAAWISSDIEVKTLLEQYPPNASEVCKAIHYAIHAMNTKSLEFLLKQLKLPEE
ncbi:MAG: hypothetical protein H2069_07905 [Legionella sp.]|nr:hypothetical protein [Legionella sp.]